MGLGIALCVFTFRPPHKLSSIISTLLRERQGGQVNANSSLRTAAALWARHSQHLKNAATTKAALEDNDDAASGNNPTDASEPEPDQGKFHLHQQSTSWGVPQSWVDDGVRAWGTTYL